jgi:lipid-binding SYLF domain-containing protein
MAVSTNSKQETFMKMASAGAGLGIGVKDYRVIFAAAKAGEKGAAYSGAVEVAPGVWVYEITQNGLALELTLQGTKYYKDDDLNKK